jgi:hypothetical protein
VHPARHEHQGQETHRGALAIQQCMIQALRAVTGQDVALAVLAHTGTHDRLQATKSKQVPTLSFGGQCLSRQ